MRRWRSLAFGALLISGCATGDPSQGDYRVSLVVITPGPV